MSRTMIEVPMKTNNVDEVLNVIAEIMEPAGYEKKIIDGETAWVKGDGVMILMRCVNAVFTGNSVVIQGWSRDAFLGEADLEGFIGKVPKKKVKALMEKAQSRIIAKNL